MTRIAAAVAAVAALVGVAINDGDGSAVAQGTVDAAQLRAQLADQLRVRIPPDAALISARETGGHFGYAKRYWFEYAPRRAAQTDAALCTDLGLPLIATVDPANFHDAELTQHFGDGASDRLVCGASTDDSANGGADRNVVAGRRYLLVVLGAND